MREIILGLTIGIGAMVYVLNKGNMLGLFFNSDAAILVFGGTLGAIIITYPFRVLRNCLAAIMIAIFGRSRYKPQELIETLVSLSEKVRKDGLYSINDEISKLDKFLQDGLKMILDGIDAHLIRENLQKEITFTRKRHEQIIGVLNNAGTYSPIFGLLGTLMGIVQVLKNITDIKSLGTSMAMAVTATFYGIFGTNFIYLPLAGKLEATSDEELLIKEVMIEGIVSIQQGDIPIITARKLEAFISTKQRKQKV
jgi:chemotaxis protein MotA